MNQVSEQLASGSVSATFSREQEMLLEFLRDHEAPCPVCRYNLKALVRPVCPECGHDLVLTVGTPPLRLGWLLAAVAPGFFSGIAAIFTLVPIVGRVIFGDGRMTWPLVFLDLFGWCSGVFAILLGINRQRFLAMSRASQRWWAIGIWLVHVGALATFLLIGFGVL